MGLAPYGIEDSNETNLYIDKIKSEIVDIKEDGSIFEIKNILSIPMD